MSPTNDTQAPPLPADHMHIKKSTRIRQPPIHLQDYYCGTVCSIQESSQDSASTSCSSKAGYQNCELPVPQKFKIHGFLPVDNNGQVMHNEDQFGRNYLKEEDVHIKEELDEMWLDLRREKQNFYFWAEEWKKHGNDIGYTPNSYFKLALLCKKKLDETIEGDLVEYLSGIGFEPHATADYWNQQFPIKMLKKTKSVAEIKCNTADGKSQLFEIYICFTGTGVIKRCNYLVDAKNKMYYYAHNCDHRIIFPVEKEQEQEPLSRSNKDEL
ncbi:unnamed protein product [Fraxinus pennsylvanica]|uniref:Uncharacterized protein n=1 Tax=Fraxinus pennsylvanica TaxID=56036 RepID=A0AAD2AAY4_9LAMI|nr:unnamed protein product [Fraxinus pennsylvanica]